MTQPVVSAHAYEAQPSVRYLPDPVVVGNGWLVLAYTPRGDVYAHEAGAFARREDAVRLAARVEAAGAIDLDHWVYERAAYGSEAWEADGWDRRAMELEAEEAAWDI